MKQAVELQTWSGADARAQIRVDDAEISSVRLLSLFGVKEHDFSRMRSYSAAPI